MAALPLVSDAIIDALPGHVYWKDLSGAYLGCNRLQAKSYGLGSAKEVIGKTDYDFYLPSEAEALRAIDANVVKTEQAVTQHEVGHLNGIEHHFMSKKVPLYDASGAVVGILGVSFDITEEHRQQSQKLHMLDMIISLMPGNVYWKDKNGRYLGCNHEQAKAAKLDSREAIIGKTDHDMPWRLFADQIHEMDLEVIQTGKPIQREEHGPMDHGGEESFLSQKVPLRYDGEIIGLLGMSINITDSKRAEVLAREVAVNKALASSMQLLAASIAHEMRTPLATISIAADVLSNTLPDMVSGYQLAEDAGLVVKSVPEKRRITLMALPEKIKKVVHSANIFINMLLVKANLKKPDKERFTTLSMACCIEKALENYPYKDDADRQLIHWEAQTDFQFIGDEEMMVHILFNLLKNALYYVKAAQKGQIDLHLKISEQGESVLYFRDTGAGMPESVRQHIFEGFYSQTRHGTGVGLAFCKMVMESFGGDISCQSKEGEYTEFMLQFPPLRE